MLGYWNVQCEKTSDIEEGLHQLRVAASSSKPFDCAIIDSALTPEDHLLVARRIRNNPETARLPIILLTSISKPLGVGEVSALGHMSCVNKPVLPLELRFNLLQSVRDELDHRSKSVGEAAAEVVEALSVAAEHLNECEPMVCQPHRLSALHVGVAR